MIIHHPLFHHHRTIIHHHFTIIFSQSPPSVEEEEEPELPDAIILTNLPKIIFEDPELKGELEELFKEIDPHATFLYFKVSWMSWL